MTVFLPMDIGPVQCPGCSLPSTHRCPHHACFCHPRGEQGVTLIPAEATALLVSCRWMELAVRAVLGVLVPAGSVSRMQLLCRRGVLMCMCC